MSTKEEKEMPFMPFKLATHLRRMVLDARHDKVGMHAVASLQGLSHSISVPHSFCSLEHTR